MIVLFLGQLDAAGHDPSRHAEMQQQQAVGVELDQDVLAAPPELANAGAVEPLGQHRREGPAQIGPAQFGAGDAAAAHPQRQATPHGLDFGKLGHVQWFQQSDQAIFLPDARG